MGGGIKIGRLFGIEIAIHPTWFIILAVITWSLATGVFRTAFAASEATYWIVAAIAALLLFASVLVHELAHSLVARAQGIPVKGITLFLLGGVSAIEKDASSPGREALMAGVGPLTSLVLGGLFVLGGFAIGSPATVHATFVYLGLVNIALAVFNILPGFPLDGGRVLRAVLWARSHDFERATRGASRAGHAFGYLMIAGGVVLAITGHLVEGIWTGFIGWVLVQASQAAYQQVVTTRRLSGITVRRMMTEPRGWVPPFVTLDAAAHDYFLAQNARCLPVEGGLDEFDGVICLSDLQRRPRSEWNHDRVHDVMTPRDKVATVGPDEPAAQALQLMAERNINQVAVVAGEKLLGFVDRAAAIEYMRLHETVGGDNSGDDAGDTGGQADDATGDDPRRDSPHAAA